MKASTPLSHAASLIPFLPLVLGQNLVSISSEIPSNGHDCIKECVYYPGIYSDIATALDCARPVENECYCAEASASASAASGWINRCASSRCAGGDLTRDISSMRSIYAGYCNRAGFTQPIISEWFTTEAEDPKPTSDSNGGDSSGDGGSRTTDGDSLPAATSTRLTSVTQTTTDSGAGAGAQRSTVIEDVTTTVWVNPEGSILPADFKPSGSGGDNNTMKLGIGLGVGLGVAFILIGVGVWLCMRRRKRNQFHAQPPAYNYEQDNHNNNNNMYNNDPNMAAAAMPVAVPPTETVSPVSSPVSRVERKAVPSPMSTPVYTPPPQQPEKTELSGQHVTREISGTEVHPFPNQAPSPPVHLDGQHEMWADGRMTTTAATTQTHTTTTMTDGPNELAQGDPRYELGRGDPRYELGRSDPRYELPGR